MIGELLPTIKDDKEDDEDPRARYAAINIYQKKTGSILFATITTRPDVAFAISRLARFNINPGKIHHQAADRATQYFYGMKELALRTARAPRNI
jgi:hypothetical protein